MENSAAYLSFILPVLNESAGLGATLAGLESLRQNGAEIIVVDGGSSDASPLLARSMGATVMETGQGRGRQMNAGARQASGDILVFVHGDTRLPKSVLDFLENGGLKRAAWGYFNVSLSGSSWQFRLIESLINWRSRLSGIGTGDQVIFVRRELFVETGGYADIPLMEDIELCKRLKRHHGRPVRVPLVVITSSRRWQQQGIARTVVLMWCLRLAYFIGVSPGRLAKIYYR